MSDRSDKARAGDAPEGERRARRPRRAPRPKAPEAEAPQAEAPKTEAPEPEEAPEASETSASAGADDVAPSPARGVSYWLRHFFVEGPTIRELLRDAYFTADRRTLGFA